MPNTRNGEPQTTIRVTQATRDKLAAIAYMTNQSLGELLAVLAEIDRRVIFDMTTAFREGLFMAGEAAARESAQRASRGLK